MPQCPVCQSEVSDDFGLIECSQCKTPLFVQMDGTVQSMASGAPAGLEEPAQDNFQDNIADVLVDEALMPAETSGPDLQPSFSSESSIEAEPFAEMQMEDQSLEMADAPPAEDLLSEPSPSEEPMVEESAAEEPIAEDLGQEPIEAMPEEASDAPAEPSADDIDAFFDDEPVPSPLAPPTPISDLSQLANSTDTDAQAGSIRYNIAIAGIDTAEIRKEFRDLISDRRFLFDVDGVLKSIRSGRVRMQNVTAVKAILLIQRLRGLPVNVQWEQHVVHTD